MVNSIPPPRACPHHALFLKLVALAICFVDTNAFGGEKATLYTTPLSVDQTAHRQDVCERYEQYRAGEIQLRDALSGLFIRPALVKEEERNDQYLKYSHESGLGRQYPGIMVELLDAVAQHANFTWRNSFAVLESAFELNMTWTDLLYWTVDNYDISITHWDHTVERMENGVTYPEPWFDASLILIDRTTASPNDDDAIDVFNWTRPFEPAVWGMILFTVVLSGLVYQLIEYLQGERGDRSFYQWFSDNVYLSAINFSQNFEYAPSSLAGRIFGVSMTIWALVITATYTANLASLFVQSKVEPILVDSMEKAVVYGYPVCTRANTNADDYIRETFPKAARKPRDTEMEIFESLRRRECALGVTDLDTWLTVQEDRDYNPDCNLEWVGAKVKTIKSGFAVKADSGYKCSSLIRHVVNLHLVELVEEGTLAELWRKYREKENDHLCSYQGDDDGQSTRRLQSENGQRQSTGRHSELGPSPSRIHRVLKGGGKAAGGQTTSGDNGVASDTLTLQEMLGTFILHWGAMAVAISISIFSLCAKKLKCCYKDGVVLEKLTYRTHGPKIGWSTPVNTWVVRKNFEDSSVDSSEPVNTQSDDPGCHGQAASSWQTELAETMEQRRSLDQRRNALDEQQSALYAEQKAIDGERKALDSKMESILLKMSSTPQPRQHDV